mgnify:CR=1 FL=1
MESETSDSWKARAFAWAHTRGSAVVLLGIVALLAALAGLLFGEAEPGEGISTVVGALTAISLGRYLAKHG